MSIPRALKIITAVALAVSAAAPTIAISAEPHFMADYLARSGGCEAFNYGDIGFNTAPYGKAITEWTKEDIELYARTSLRCLDEVSARRGEHPDNARAYREQFQSYLAGVEKLILERKEEKVERQRLEAEANRLQAEQQAAEAAASDLLSRTSQLLSQNRDTPSPEVRQKIEALLSEYTAREIQLASTTRADAVQSASRELQSAYAASDPDLVARLLSREIPPPETAPDIKAPLQQSLLEGFLNRPADIVKLQCELSRMTFFNGTVDPNDGPQAIVIEAGRDEGDTALMDGLGVKIRERRGTVIALEGAALFRLAMGVYFDTLIAQGVITPAQRLEAEEKFGVSEGGDPSASIRADPMIAAAMPAPDGVLIIDLKDGSATAGRLVSGQVVGGGPVNCRMF